MKTPVLAIVVFVLLALPLAGVAAAADPTNGITAPAEGAKVSGITKVMGYANDPNFARWQLDLLPGGDATKAASLRVSTTPGEVAYSLDTTLFPVGAHALRLRVVRPDGNYQEYLTNFSIIAPTTLLAATPRDPGATLTATSSATTTSTTTTTTANGITAPAEGAKVSGITKVTGYANDPNFAKWQLDLLPGADATKAASLMVGTTPGEVTYSLDTTVFPVVAHALRLRVVRPDGNYQEYVTNFSIIAPTTLLAATPRDPGSTLTATSSTTTTSTTTSTTTTTTPNGITAPSAGATVSGIVNVTGYANDPNFAKWQLDLLPGGDAANAASLTVSTTPGEVAYSLDTTVFPAGAHSLRLRVVYPDGNYQEYLTSLIIAQ